MRISKTTLNFAAKRNIELIVDDSFVSFFDSLDDSEPMFIYSISHDDGKLFFHANIYLSFDIKEELPYMIDSELRLRELINFISNSIR